MTATVLGCCGNGDPDSPAQQGRQRRQQVESFFLPSPPTCCCPLLSLNSEALKSLPTTTFSNHNSPSSFHIRLRTRQQETSLAMLVPRLAGNTPGTRQREGSSHCCCCGHYSQPEQSGAALEHLLPDPPVPTTARTAVAGQLCCWG